MLQAWEWWVLKFVLPLRTQGAPHSIVHNGHLDGHPQPATPCIAPFTPSSCFTHPWTPTTWRPLCARSSPA